MDWSLKYFWNMSSVPLYFIIALRLLLRPRKPKVIYAHFNRMINGIFWSLAIFILMSMVVLIQFSHFLPVFSQIPSLFNIIVVVMIGLLLLSNAYFGYWAHSYSRKRAGIKAVDKAVMRYKKPDEQVEDAWVPTLILNGKRYRNAFYVGKEKEWIVTDEEGEVLRDEATANTLRDMLRLVLQTAHPEFMNARASAYSSSQKGIKSMKMLLRKYKRLMKPVFKIGGKKYFDEINAVNKAAKVGLRFQESMSAYWLLEAEWGEKQGGTKLKELTYEEWQKVMGYLHEQTLWLQDEIKTLQKGAKAALKILQLIAKNDQIKKHSPELAELLRVVLQQEAGLRSAFGDLEKGRIQGYERGMDPDELAGWHSRLAWVDQVDAQITAQK